MLYVGFTIPAEEAFRLLKLPEYTVTSFYDTQPIQKYLKEKGSKITFQYIDKGACVFGVNVHMRQESSVEDTIMAMITAKKVFLWEVKTLGLDISKVNINRIDEDSWLVENPEPFVIEC
jgi:hypothetical protein